MRTLTILLIAALLAPAANLFSDRRAPGFSLPDSKFGQHDLQDFRGKVVLIDIMQTGCPTCNKLADTLVQLKAKYGDKIGILSVVTIPDTPSQADAFASRHGMSWPIVLDSGQMIASYLEVTPANPTVTFPHLFIIDGQGMIRNDYSEADETRLTVETFSAAIDKLLGGNGKRTFCEGSSGLPPMQREGNRAGCTCIAGSLLAVVQSRARRLRGNTVSTTRQ